MRRFLLLLLLLPLPLSGDALLKGVRSFTYPDYTRVVLDLSDPVTFTTKELKEPGRVRFFFDIAQTRLTHELVLLKTIPVGVGYLKEIRVGQFTPRIARVVLEFPEVRTLKTFLLANPFRIVIDIYGQRSEEKEVLPSLKRPPKSETTTTIKPPADLSGEKGLSLTRQLGLRVKRVVIDPGHGGKDPGTIGKVKGLPEKEVVLDVSLRLKALLEKGSDLEVILTRQNDTFLSLEERTALANSRHADLFISVHANAAKNRSASGLETFWLNFTSDPHAVEIAAAENSSSERSIWELQGLLKKISLTSKLIESRIFANQIHKSVLEKTRTKVPDYQDYNVRKAPFYVLIGASMPATLVEIGFLSNRANEELLEDPLFREKIAEGLYEGILSYIRSLGEK